MAPPLLAFTRLFGLVGTLPKVIHTNRNVNLPTGTLWGENQAFTLRASGQLMNASAFQQMIVAYRNGSPVRLSELGRVIDGVQNDIAHVGFRSRWSPRAPSRARQNRS